MAEKIHIRLIQDSFLVGDVKGNARKIITLSQQARQSGVDLVVFPELALSGYPPEDLLLRQGFIRQIDTAIKQIQQSVTGIDVVLGAPRHDGEQLFNSAFWIRDGEQLAVYDKYTLPNYAVFDEKRYFSGGDQPAVVALKGVTFGLSICEDIWYPEPATQAAKAGAKTMLILNASPYHRGKYQERLDTLQQRIQETGMSMFYLNIVGGQDELVFDGESMVLDSAGQLISQGPDFESVALDVWIDDKGRLGADQPLLPAPLSEETSVYKALVTAVRDYVGNNGFDGVVIGLSGGVDSALTLAIAVDALGADQVHAVMMPSRYTAQISLDDAAEEARNLGVDYRIISIEPSFQAFLETLHEDLAGTEPDTTEENIQARCRGVILMALSNKLRRMLLTTGNKSEMAVGYSTLYGDMAGGFAPLKDVSKTLVYRLCHYRNSISSVIPLRVIERAPSAELRPDQVDQDSLPDYAVLDAILELSVEQDRPRAEVIAAGYDEAIVDRVIRMVQLNEYKRRQAPPGVRITRRAFGRDRRYPITSGYRRG
ncbi:MAG: NAD+ synthase [Gammaproteobacteria bacterium]